MLYAYAIRFDVMDQNLEKFFVFRVNLGLVQKNFAKNFILSVTSNLAAHA